MRPRLTRLTGELTRLTVGLTGLTLGLTVCLSACGPKGATVPTSAASKDMGAAAGITDRTLATLLRDHWSWTMRVYPEWATQLGDARYADRVRDMSLAGADAAGAEQLAFLERALAIDESKLGSRDAMYLELLRGDLQSGIDAAPCRFHTWSISPRMNALVDIQSALAVQALDTPAAREAYLARVGAWSAAVPDHLDALRSGAADGWVANETSLGLVSEMLRKQLALPAEEWPMYRLPEGTPDAQTLAFGQALVDRIDSSARPALEAYADLIDQELRPIARDDTSPGLASLPEGEACYAAQVRSYTTLPLTADELHQRGLDELARIHREFIKPGAMVLGVWERPALFERLRTESSLYFEDEESIVAKATSALEEAQAVVPDVFGRLPQTPCVVSPIPEYEAPYTTIAYYRPPPGDGSAPGTYFVNTYEPTTRPRHEAEVLAFHESVPGHHLQIAISYELPEVPAFHRFSGQTVFVEGWALYSERLADELGLYSGPSDILGMLSFDAWRASRLVVDTGLHHKGWSREEAVQFMLDNTPLPENNIRNEVDRYITWPGQALAYKTGQLEILALRAEAEAQLGDRFDLSSFHDTILERGAVSMPVLKSHVSAWIEASKAAP